MTKQAGTAGGHGAHLGRRQATLTRDGPRRQRRKMAISGRRWWAGADSDYIRPAPIGRGRAPLLGRGPRAAFRGCSTPQASLQAAPPPGASPAAGPLRVASGPPAKRGLHWVAVAVLPRRRGAWQCRLTCASAPPRPAPWPRGSALRFGPRIAPSQRPGSLAWLVGLARWPRADLRPYLIYRSPPCPVPSPLLPSAAAARDRGGESPTG